MTRKIYRTAQGKMVDLGALQLQNENVRAVGNMSVNARGDLIDSRNKPISTKNQQVTKQYNKQTTNVTNKSIVAEKNKIKPNVVDIPSPPEDFDDNFDRVPAPAVTKSNEPDLTPAQLPPTGLAAAIARARQVKQEPLKTPRQAAQEQAGVKKL